MLRQHFSDQQLATLTPLLDPSKPTGLDYYPLPRPGERFPVNDPHMQPRLSPRPDNDALFLQGEPRGRTLCWWLSCTHRCAMRERCGRCGVLCSKRVRACLEIAAGLLEGMAAVEARAYRLLAQLGASPVKLVLTAGGGAVNDKWTAMRAAALGVPVRPAAQGAWPRRCCVRDSLFANALLRWISDTCCCCCCCR